MTERLTSIRLPGSIDPGLADWGRKSPSEMIAMYREHAEHQLKCAQEVLSATDDNFRIETYVGVHVRRKAEILQEGK